MKLQLAVDFYLNNFNVLFVNPSLQLKQEPINIINSGLYVTRSVEEKLRGNDIKQILKLMILNSTFIWQTGYYVSSEYQDPDIRYKLFQ
jgi:hypothetical protein